MRNKLALGFLAFITWLLIAANAWAVALGKISVASHLGERFFAEVPLQLDPGESISSVFVSLASPSDYRILEIYRDPALGAIQVGVKNDSRGPRVVLSSNTAVDAPFFNLVLKLRYGRATQFKKYPVFLDIPNAAKPARVVPVPKSTPSRHKASTVASAPSTTVTETNVAPKPPAHTTPKPGSTFTPFDGWARISRYGPMVYGDTITTVAHRLMIDHRFTRDQVMVALFDKNRTKFDNDNINLIRAGTYLNVPTAAEVERISPADARSIIAKQEKIWKELIKQPKYAAIAKAQKNRYSKRVRVGEMAGGVASAPLATTGTKGQGKQTAAVQAKPGVHTVQKQAAAPSSAAATAAMKGKQSQMQQQLQQLQQQNADLKKKLAESQQQISKTAASQPSDMAVAAADKARIQKLQIKLARMQAQRDEALQKAKSQPSSIGWLNYVLFAVIILLIALIGFLMRRDRSHPAMDYPVPDEESDYSAESKSIIPQFATNTFDDSQTFEDAPEIEVEEVPDIDTEATTQLSAVDLSRMTDSVPDLTDEDTGEMEAFQEEVEEEPDPNVDYLAEADVYMRYGMEEEATRQVRMALKLDAQNPDAHAKLVQILKAKKDDLAVEAAMQAARQDLSGEALNHFEDKVSRMNQVADVFGDTLPPTLAENLVELPDEKSSEDASGQETPSSSDEVDKAMNDVMSLSGEWPEFEDADLSSVEESKSDSQLNTTSEQEAFITKDESQLESEPPEHIVTGSKEFDLSDIEIPESEIKDAGSDESPSERFLDTGDMEKTVAIDWSKDTSVDTGDHEEMISESGANSFEDTMTSEELESQLGNTGESKKPDDIPEKPESAIDDAIELGDFDFDQHEKDLSLESTADDEFSSTIRTTLEKIDASSDGGLDFDLSSELESDKQIDTDDDHKSASGIATKKDDDGNGLLDLDEDFDDTGNLHRVLDELSEESEKDVDKEDNEDKEDKKKP